MTPEQKLLIHESWNQLLPAADNLVETFYRRLFQLDPSLRQLFADTDMKTQSRKLSRAITTAVMSLDNLEMVTPALQAMGRQHRGYGVEPAHYAIVARALLETLADGLGTSFTPQVKAAWAETFSIISGVMLAAAAQAELASK